MQMRYLKRKKPRFFLTLLIGGVALLIVPSAFAGEKKSEKKKTASAEAGTLPRPGRIIAVIDNEPVTLRDFEEYARVITTKDLPEEGTEEFKRLYEDYMVQLLVEAEAKTMNISVSEDDIKAYLEGVKQQNNINDAQLEELLKKKGLTLTSYRKQITQEVLRSRLTQAHARSTINISDSDIHKHLGVEAPAKAADEEHLYQVFVPIGEDGESSAYRLADSAATSTSEEARERRRKIIDEISSKCNTAKDLKTSGGSYFVDLGRVNPEDLLSEIREAVEDLSSDEVSGVVETEKGFYLFAIGEATSHVYALSDETKEKARKQLFEGKLREEMENFITKELPKKHNLEKKL